MARALDRYGEAALKFKAGARDATGQDLSLFVDKLQQEIGVLVVDVFDACFFEAAVLFLSGFGTDTVYRCGSDVTFSSSSSSSLCHDVLRFTCFSVFSQSKSLFAAFDIECQGMLVKLGSQVAQHCVVVTVVLLQLGNELRISFKFNVNVETV